MTPTANLTWFARHEVRLAWRDWLAMLRGGRPGRTRKAIVALVVFAALMHLLAYSVVGRFAEISTAADKTTFVVITASVLLAWLLMLSQAIESVTRVFYARADLDLLMSSPVPLPNVFSIRMIAIVLTITAMALLIAAPFINVLALAGGARWLAAYGAVIAVGISATAVAIAFTVMLFRLLGPRRSRLVAQILAVVIGASFIIGLQIAAVISYGTLSRFTVLTSDVAAAFAPDADSLVWYPVRAVLGDGWALTGVLGCSFVLLGVAMARFLPGLADDVMRASTHAAPVASRRQGRARFRVASRQQALRRKELVLLRRDPWLVSQTLMQLLYLLPPALMLWRSFSDHADGAVLATPVLVMAAGQLAGGLAWLTISGEDAADLVATAPLPVMQVTRAKIEVVLMVIAVVFAPLLLPLLFIAPAQATVAAFGIAVATLSATAIQLWFRVAARRSQFRRRQTASRLATFAEAFSSIGWSATAAMVLSNPVIAAVTALLTLGALAATWTFSPARG
ncbi:MAG: permease [Rhizobiales bacterium 62-47]|nr:permease [Hyphomicrobiales bacterium]OJY10934.1 MAG: permease [Rhizobiales bacterium 62-47]